MRLVQIKLHHSYPFWFLNDQIRLNAENPVSDFINIDSLDKEYKETINASVRNFRIKLFDPEGRQIKHLSELSVIEGDIKVSTEDIKKTESNFPEITSVTVQAEEEEEVEREEAPDRSEEAKILLNQNGHTVKRSILSVPKENDSLYLLHAMLSLEDSEEGKNRKGVIVALTTAIGEY